MCIWNKINDALAERAALLLLNRVNTSSRIFCTSSNFIIGSLSKSKYIVILNNRLSAACREM